MTNKLHDQVEASAPSSLQLDVANAIKLALLAPRVPANAYALLEALDRQLSNREWQIVDLASRGQAPPQVVSQDLSAGLAAVVNDTGSSTTEAASGYLACHVCGKPAYCIGSYEGDSQYRPACDACCGHGNEDGWCRPINEAIAKMSEWIEEANTNDDRAIHVLNDLWLWASERRNHLDSDPVPDGLGHRVLSVLAGNQPSTEVSSPTAASPALKEPSPNLAPPQRETEHDGAALLPADPSAAVQTETLPRSYAPFADMPQGRKRDDMLERWRRS